MTPQILTRSGAIQEIAPPSKAPRTPREPRNARKVKGTSDYIPFETAFNKGRELLWSDKPEIGFLIILGINTGLRISDMLARKHSDFMNLKTGDYLNIIEKKTGKVRRVKVNEYVYKAYQDLKKTLSRINPDGFIFLSQKNKVFATVSVNRILKDEFAGVAPTISTHTLRKTFGRRYYDSHGQTDYSLHILSDMFRHSNVALTRRYLGLRQDEFDNGYDSLVTTPW